MLFVKEAVLQFFCFTEILKNRTRKCIFNESYHAYIYAGYQETIKTLPETLSINTGSYESEEV